MIATLLIDHKSRERFGLSLYLRGGRNRFLKRLFGDRVGLNRLILFLYALNVNWYILLIHLISHRSSMLIGLKLLTDDEIGGAWDFQKRNDLI